MASAEGYVNWPRHFQAWPQVSGGRRAISHARIAIGGAAYHALKSPRTAHLRIVVERRDEMHLAGAGVGEAHRDPRIDQRLNQALRAIHGACSPVAQVHECSPGLPGYTFPLTTPEAEIPMKQLQTTGAGTPLAWVDGPTPEPKGAEVLLRTVACGVCHPMCTYMMGFLIWGRWQRYPWPGRA